jgi:hypothetical protein
MWQSRDRLVARMMKSLRPSIAVLAAGLYLAARPPLSCSYHDPVIVNGEFPK